MSEATGVWRYQIHPEVWILVVGLIVLYVWAVRVVGPKVVPEGEKVLSRRNVVCAVIGVALLVGGRVVGGQACGDRAALAVPGGRVHAVAPARQAEAVAGQAEVRSDGVGDGGAGR